MSNRNDTIEIDLGSILTILAGKLWLLVATGLFCAVLGFMASEFLIPPSYESTTKIYILNKQESANLTYSDMQLGTQLTKDYAELIKSRYVLEGVAQEQSLALTYKEMLKKVSVATPTDTRIVAITVKDTDPIMAMRIANSIREVSSEHIRSVMDIDAVNVVETANMPTQRSEPSVIKWTIIGGLIGVFLVCVVAFAQYLTDDTIKSAEDVHKYLGLSTLALIPMREDAPGRRD